MAVNLGRCKTEKCQIKKFRQAGHDYKPAGVIRNGKVQHKRCGAPYRSMQKNGQRVCSLKGRERHEDAPLRARMGTKSIKTPTARFVRNADARDANLPVARPVKKKMSAAEAKKLNDYVAMMMGAHTLTQFRRKQR